ncbi:uncharacterized protein LOC118270383 [Spodoptera frugiperda]|uniref:Uncharacterized protein LOC118270383 n=1 Tax=Spodoptera frugiperda TaxID=7108 RepID=A0A9R0ELM8_SPOFR|nr:uncharacterized protein LOC118270383 [Spodoptera frugiperda]
MFHKLVSNLLFWCILLVIWPDEAICQAPGDKLDGREQKEVDKRAPPPNQFEKMQQKMVLPLFDLVTYGPTIVFEGVDYDLLATPTYKEYYDCYYLHTKCVRDQSNFNEVCAYHLVLGWINFATPCEIDLANCLHRMEMGIPMYGGDKKQDTIFFQGEGSNCQGTQ